MQALNIENPTSTDLQPGLKAGIEFVCCLFLFLTKLSHPLALTLVFNIKYKNGCVGSPVVSAGPVHVRLEIFLSTAQDDESKSQLQVSINANIQLVFKTPKPTGLAEACETWSVYTRLNSELARDTDGGSTVTLNRYIQNSVNACQKNQHCQNMLGTRISSHFKRKYSELVFLKILWKKK